MGNSPSNPLQTCLDAVCNGRSGCVSYPGDVLYQVAWVKPYNLDVPVVPAAVIRPRDGRQVAAAVRCAAQNGVRVQAKSGGHSYANFGIGGEDGELSIDLVNLDHFSYDEATQEAALGAGFRLGALDKKLLAHGRAIAHGTCPGVGIGGHATVGGLGPMSRMWGSALDHVLAVEVVTAQGDVVTAGPDHNADLFWALRGAGASFGIVTRFTVATHPAPRDVVEYSYSLSLGSATQMAPVFEAWQALAGDPGLDRRFSTLFIAHPLGALVTGIWYGTKADFDASGIPARMPGGGSVDVRLTDWLGHLGHMAELVGLHLGDVSSHFYSKSLAFAGKDLLGRDAIRSLFDYMDRAAAGTPLWAVIFNSEGGAMADTAPDATAYPHRDTLIMYQSYIIGILGLSSQSRDFAEGIHARIRRGAPAANTTYAGYVDKALSRPDAQRVYWGHNLQRLRQIKRRWDPTDVFHNPQSVDPAPA